MNKLAIVAVLGIVGSIPANAQVPCETGVFKQSDGDFVVLTRRPDGSPSPIRYLFRDGRRGGVAESAGLVVCEQGSVRVRVGGAVERWAKRALMETPTSFQSAATKLEGMLIEPAGTGSPKRPLVVMVHGSERTSAIGGAYPYVLAAQDISVFVYDKRGTGKSEGEYTQNFELLAVDAATALAHARKLATGRFTRTGFFGGSQGGWVAPLAAVKGGADFVAVGFGLVASPIDEDREQMENEVRAAGLGDAALAQVNRLSSATATLIRSGFTQGYGELDAVRRELLPQAWSAKLKGEYSGDMFRMSDEELRRIGRARFDNLELIWDYDAFATLKRLRAPQLWVLAGEDREAPVATTRRALTTLAATGKPITVYLFPRTDHGMLEFTTNSAGTRTPTRVTDGYFKLLADWIKSKVRGSYGAAEQLTTKVQ